MANNIGKLTALAVSRLKKPGLYADGGGLYLRVRNGGGKFWAFRYMRNGAAREMGLGAFHTVTLAEARDKAVECRKMLTNNIDPIADRKKAEAELLAASAKTKTFRECAEAYIAAHSAGWRNEKHVNQWTSTLTTYAYPTMGKLAVQDIDVAAVMKVLDPIWQVKTETASRLRGRIEVILDWATAREYRRGENPARWRGHLENLLPRRSKVRRVRHQPALPYNQIGDFMVTLRKQAGVSAQALEFAILTAARTSEVIGARWSEIDMKNGIWTIPANRIKAEREHRVPLSGAAVEILHELDEKRPADKKIREAQAASKTDWIFNGQRAGKHLSNMAMLTLLKRLTNDCTTHGFRSSFRDWCAEQTNFPREVAEAALAHAVGDKVEAAYRRSDLFEKRKLMMAAWARYCAIPSKIDNDVVTPLRKSKAA